MSPPPCASPSLCLSLRLPSSSHTILAIPGVSPPWLVASLSRNGPGCPGEAGELCRRGAKGSTPTPGGRSQLPVHRPHTSVRTTRPRPCAPCPFLLLGPAWMSASPDACDHFPWLCCPSPGWAALAWPRLEKHLPRPVCSAFPGTPPQGLRSATASRCPRTAVVTGVDFLPSGRSTQAVPKRSPQPERKAARHTV